MTQTHDAAAQAIAREAGAVWPQDAERYRRYAAVALAAGQAEAEALKGEVERLREALEAIAIGSRRRSFIGSPYAGMLARGIARAALSEPTQ